MPTYTGTVNSPKPVGEVFPYMADFSNTKDWDPNITETSVTSTGDPVRVGATFHVVQGSGMTKVELDYETIELVDGQKVVLRAETDSLVSIDTITVAPEGAGSTVTYEVEISLKGARKVAEPVMALFLKRIGNEAREGLEKQLS
ncbi:SRPBCC family protein [Patulibacter sp.]|uniref:SRPBCC family protein n=1 Tax=Patulibacter sp. TaxID=1912859 RepID=UPI00271847C4|nr:SRPBCC family protein [Patulibacter sp.]MDO9407735.1 SRPBCC family protein [Patulibacter sp.]